MAASENTDSLPPFSHTSQPLGPTLSQLEQHNTEETLMVTQDAGAQARSMHLWGLPGYRAS